MNLLAQLKFFKDDGSVPTPGGEDVGTTLAVGTYYAEFGAGGTESQRVEALQLEWDATLAATVTVERTNKTTPTSHSAAGTSWTTGGAPAINIPGGVAATTIADYLNSGSFRERIKVVVTVGGALLAKVNFKWGG